MKEMENYIQTRKKIINHIKSCKEEFTYEEINEDVKEEYLKDVSDNLPNTVTKLNISSKILYENPNILSFFQNIKTLNIINLKTCTYQQINNWIKNTNINTIIFDGNFTDNFCKVDNSLAVTCKNCAMFKNDNLKIISNFKIANYLIDDVPNIYLNGKEITKEEINEIKQILEEELLKKNNQYKIFKNNNIQYSFLKNAIYPYLPEITDVLYVKLDGEIDRIIIDIKNICEIIGNPKYISIETTNKTIEDIDKLKKLESISKVYISYGDCSVCSIDDFKSMRHILDYFVSLIKENDMTPAEQICYAYDLVKSYIYRENEKNKMESRKLHSIIKTGSIVCFGYSVFLSELLKELGIKSYVIKTNNHARNIIEIEDDKYNIHGKYAFDATFDSNRERYLVQRSGCKGVVYELEPGDIILNKYNNLAAFSYSFINAESYEKIFGDKCNLELAKMNAWAFDPNEKKELIGSLGIRLESNNVKDNYENANEISHDTFELLLYNTRLKEGFTAGESISLLSEAYELRKFAIENANYFQEGNIGLEIK